MITHLRREVILTTSLDIASCGLKMAVCLFKLANEELKGRKEVCVFNDNLLLF